MTTHPSTYEAIAGFMEGNYFLRMNSGQMTWIKDPDGPNFLFIDGQSKNLDDVKGVLRPDGGYTAYITRQNLLADYSTERILRHVGIESAVTRIAANKETCFALKPRPNVRTVKDVLEVRHDNVQLEGVYMGPEFPVTSPENLCMGCRVPDEYKPRDLPKVPRKVIAQLRAHVENQFKLAQIAEKVSGKPTQRHELYHLTEDNMTKKAFGFTDLAARGKMMTTTDMEFWRFARAHYTVTGLIDSCRSEFYNAAGVRPQPVAEPPAFVPKSTAEI